MIPRPFVWHASKFGRPNVFRPWTVTLGRPKHLTDFEYGHNAETLEEAMKIAVSLVPREVP